jgi:hypothetical protein
MSAAAMLNRQLVARLRGNCQVDLLTGAGLSFLGEGQGGFSCAACPAPCEMHSDGLIHQDQLALRLLSKSDGVKLSWECPGCGASIFEDTTLLDSMGAAAEIASDPLCVKCRRGS